MEQSHGRVVNSRGGIFRNRGPGGNPSAMWLTGNTHANPKLGQQFDNWQKVELFYISELMANSDRGRARMTAALGNHRRIEIIRLLPIAAEAGSSARGHRSFLQGTNFHRLRARAAFA